MELWWILLPLLTRQVIFTTVAYRISSNRYPDYRPENSFFCLQVDTFLHFSTFPALFSSSGYSVSFIMYLVTAAYSVQVFRNRTVCSGIPNIVYLSTNFTFYFKKFKIDRICYSFDIPMKFSYKTGMAISKYLPRHSNNKMSYID